MTHGDLGNTIAITKTPRGIAYEAMAPVYDDFTAHPERLRSDGNGPVDTTPRKNAP